MRQWIIKNFGVVNHMATFFTALSLSIFYCNFFFHLPHTTYFTLSFSSLSSLPHFFLSWISIIGCWKGHDSKCWWRRESGVLCALLSKLCLTLPKSWCSFLDSVLPFPALRTTKFIYLYLFNFSWWVLSLGKNMEELEPHFFQSYWQWKNWPKLIQLWLLCVNSKTL